VKKSAIAKHGERNKKKLLRQKKHRQQKLFHKNIVKGAGLVHTVKAFFVICLLLFCFGTSLVSAGAKTTEPVLRIGILDEQSNVTISSKQPFVFRNTQNHALIGRYGANAKVSVIWKNKVLYINNVIAKVDQIDIENDSPKSSTPIVVNDKAYRGDIHLRAQVKGIGVINELLIEDYLLGVVPKEMPADWPMEALKSQTVAARTFALYNLHKHEAEGFDLCATTHCQVYGGADAEQPRSSAAVLATRGQVMLFEGKTIYAPFHTDSGGFTENSEDVWGTYLPYLRAVKDEDQAAPAHQWTVTFTPLQLQTKLQEAGYTIGTLESIELSPLQTAGKNFGDRSAAGRVKNIRFAGTASAVSLTGAKVRSILGLKSNYFDIRGLTRKNNSLLIPGNAYTKTERHTNKADGQNSEKKATADIIFEGHGWGHGLGFSQWGAKEMAQHSDYAGILTHYYTNIEIKKIY
jgi:stage II sporulation protein D